MSRFENINIKGVIDSGNSTSTPLAGGGVFTGSAVDTIDHGIVFVSVYADAASATNGLSIQQSIDGTNWDFSDSYTVGPGLGENYNIIPYARYLRVVYTNGGGAQSTFRLQTILKGSSNFNADGTESTLINGIDYESGKSGVDASTEALQSIIYEHHEIHLGVNYEITEVANLAINNVRDIRITTPNTTEYGHFIFGIIGENETEYYLYEGVTIVTAGTLITPINNNRNSANVSSMIVDYIDNTSVSNANADTTVAGATTLKHGVLGSNRDGGENSHDREIILKANTVYCMRLIANAAGYINYDLSWYEHTDKN